MKMNMRTVLTLFIIHFSLFIFLTGCGYKPSSHYAKQVMGETVSTEVLISMEDPENTVIIKDAIDSAVIMRFKSSLRDRGSAQTHLRISLKSVLFSPLQYDQNGYVIAYRTTINLGIIRKTNGTSKTYAVKGTHDFAIEAQAIISDQARFEAIQSGAGKAVDSFIALIAAEGTRATPRE